MKKYKLKKDLPRFKAGQECWVGDEGQILTKNDNGITIQMCPPNTVAKFPNILTDWFEEIPD